MKANKKTPVVFDPNEKLYSCFPTNFVKFRFFDNDFIWALRNAIPPLLDCLTACDSDFSDRIDFVRKALDIAFKAMVQIQGIRPDHIEYMDPNSFNGVNVEYVDDIDRSNTNGDAIWLDCYSGELYR